MEVIGILWVMWGLRQEWRQLSSRISEFRKQIVSRFKKPAEQGLVQPKTIELTTILPIGVIDVLDAWPSEPAQQIAWLKSRLEAEEKRSEKRSDEQFAIAMKNIGESESKMSLRVDDVRTDISGLADDLSELKESNWVPRLGGTLLTGAGLLVTALASLLA